jgi:hypothetical protein
MSPAELFVSGEKKERPFKKAFLGIMAKGNQVTTSHRYCF